MDIHFTPEKFKQFKAAYSACEGEQFTFDGAVFLKSYAKYLIEYLDGEFKKREG